MLEELEKTENRILAVGAHPDDIEFSIGRLLIRRKGKNSFVVCFTDGRKGQQGTAAKKIIDEEEYAKLRITESMKAFKELNIPEENMTFLGIRDQELSSNPYIIDRLYLLIKKTKPDYILIPPWEGAHPDHDAAHLFMRIAADNLSFDRKKIVEYGSYNNYQGRFRVQKFIPCGNSESERLIPTPNEQKRWLHIMKIFKSQKNQQLYYIPRSVSEIYRVLPDYDYSSLPYTGKQSQIIRELLNPIYPAVRKILPDKLFYETWSSINPVSVKKKLKEHMEHYRVK